MWRALLILVCFALGCSSDEVARGTAIPVTAPNAPVVADAPVEPSTTADIELSTVEITLERTECYGWCPSYQLRIHGDGRVEYHGSAFVRELGDREWRVSEEVVRELLARIAPERFFALAERYAQAVSDCPSELIGLRVADRKHKVENYWSRASLEDFKKYSRPGTAAVEEWRIHQLLSNLATAIDDAVVVGQWIGTSSERAEIARTRRSDDYLDGAPPTKFAPW